MEMSKMIMQLFITAHKKELAALQAKIDSLMLEYCPDDMTEEQIESWAEAQMDKDYE